MLYGFRALQNKLLSLGKLASLSYSPCTRMSVFIQKVNPVTGLMEWEIQREDYDYHQEVARAAFADMLHDFERNAKYHAALKKTMDKMRAAGKSIHVLDIGTGTSLLAMMAAKYGADTVTACETFKPMAECAKKVMGRNKLQDKIKLVPKRSTDMQVGLGLDMEQRANILITEVFDTELIGEGAIGTFNHAHRKLLSDDSVVIPSRATIYVQLVESSLAHRWNRLQSINLPTGDTLEAPKDTANCRGSGALHDLQLAQLKSNWFKPLSEPIPAFHFDYNSKTVTPLDDHQIIPLKSTDSGTVHGLFFWWDLDMDYEGDIVLSCAPPWAHPDGNTNEKLPWRDHWMQAIYYLPSDFVVESAGESLSLSAFRDEYSLWFDLQKGEGTSQLERPFCHCQAHNAMNFTRFGQLNDPVRLEKYVVALRKKVRPGITCVSLGDGCLLGLLAARMGAKQVYAVETNPHCRRLVEQYVRENKLEERVTVIDDIKLVEEKVDLIVSEPAFQTSILPWHNLFFWYNKENFRQVMSDRFQQLPVRAEIWAVAVEFEDLWKIRAPVQSTEGFDLQDFDRLIQDAIETSDDLVEPHPLWEYPCTALSNPVRLIELDLNDPIPDGECHERGQVKLSDTGRVNAVALWMNWSLDEETSVSGGPVRDMEVGKTVDWDVHSRQGVYFVPDGRSGGSLQYDVQFSPRTGTFKFNFSLL